MVILYEQVADFSRWDAYKLIPAFFSYWKIFRKMRPDVILTTGAAPGLVALAVGKMMGIKTIWVDKDCQCGYVIGQRACGGEICHLRLYAVGGPVLGQRSAMPGMC